jgi:hypothetical protein
MTLAPTPVRRRHRRGITPGLFLAAALVLGAIAVVLLVQHDVFQRSSSGLEGSGVPTTQTRVVAAFTAVDLAGGNTVNVWVGGKRSVVVHGDDNLVDRVTTDVVSGTLTIGDVPGSFRTVTPMFVDIHVPSLDSLRLSGSGILSVTGIDTRVLNVALPGSGLIRAAGTATRLVVGLGGSGDAQLEQLTAGDVRAVVSGSGRIVVTATGALDATVSGSGVVVYRGHPAHVRTNVTGSGAVTPE